MSRPRGRAREEQPLAPSGEAGWQNLRTQIEWSTGFWLGFVFTNHTPSAVELRLRTSELLADRGGSVAFRRPERPEAVIEVLPWLLTGAEGARGLVWVELIDIHPDWVSAWTNFAGRLNERRDLMRGAVQAGVVFSLPQPYKALTREAAPDLWSVRSIVLEVDPPVVVSRGAAPERPATRGAGAGPTIHGGDAELAAQALARAEARGDTEAAGDALLSAAAAAQESRDLEVARQRAVEALELLQDRAQRARACELLGEVELELDDRIAAESHLRAALREDPAAVTPWVYVHLSDILEQRGDLPGAHDFAAEGTRVARQRLERQPRSVEEWRTLSACLDRLSQTCRALGNLGEARMAAQESVKICRKLRELFGDTPLTLRDLSISLLKMADLAIDAGDDISARTAAQESLQLNRNLRTQLGDTPQTLRDLSVSLDKVATLAMFARDSIAAQSAIQECLELRRSLRAQLGDTPQTLRDLSVSLDKVASLAIDLGEETTARAAAEEGLELSRNLRALLGDTPQTLRDLSISLDRVSDLTRDAGDMTAARVAAQESLEFRRELRSLLGDTPQTLRDLSISLDLLAELDFAEGRLPAALCAATESVKLSRTLLGQLGETPNTLRDLGIGLAQQARIERELDLIDAVVHQAEADELWQRFQGE